MVGANVVETIKKRIDNIVCPICNKEEWLECDTPVAALPIGENYGPAQGKIVPCVNITCKNCGYTAYFNVDVLGMKIVNK